MKDYPNELHWQMSPAERYAITSLLREIKPKIAIEIGAYQGGSLQVISHFSERVISIDIDPEVEVNLRGKFPNVDLRIGDSHQILKELIQELNKKGLSPDFILIDGDHSEEGVKRDVELVLNMIPQQECTILLHDSFNPICRSGMMKANWEGCSYVRFVELDFIQGVFHANARDTAESNTMWGGFAKGILSPEKREGELEIK